MEMDRLFRAHAARLLPASVAAKGLRLEWLGQRATVLGLPAADPHGEGDGGRGSGGGGRVVA